MYLLWHVSVKLDLFGGWVGFEQFLLAHKVINQQFDRKLCCLIRADICPISHVYDGKGCG